MATVQTLDWNKIITRGLVAGIIGGILIDAFLYVATMMPQHAPITMIWQFVASAAIGKSAFANPNSAWLGLLMHFVISIAWGIAFSYVAHTRAQVAEHPYLSGVVFGVIVMVIMDIVTMAANVMAPITAMSLVMGLIAHCVFFGLPVSLYVSRAIRS